MKNFFLLFLLIAACSGLSGCNAPSQEPTVRVVTGISVEASGSQSIRRTYTTDREMSNILNYLRLLDPYISVQLSPDTFRTDTYEIIVTYSDGNHTRYRQIYSDYFQQDNGSWKKIDPKIGGRLKELLLLPSGKI